MIAANQPVQRPSYTKVLVADRKGNIEHMSVRVSEAVTARRCGGCE